MKILERLREYCSFKKETHDKANKRYSQKNLYFIIPSIFITALSGIFSFLSTASSISTDLSLIFSILYFILIIWFSETLNKSNDNNDENLNENLPFVSIIVAGHNEEKNITTLLKSLKKQTYNQKLYEILFVDDRSNDKTSQLVKENLSDNIKLIKIVETPIGWSNKKWALNQGIKLSKGQIIVQTDADCVPNEKWLETTVKAFSDENTGFVCGPSPLYSKNKIQRILQLENNAQDAFSAAGMMNNLTLSCTGRNMAFQKIIFKLPNMSIK